MCISCSEFAKRLDPNLPFFLWTTNTPFNQVLPDFDANEGEEEDDHNYNRRGDLRLHRLRRNAREDGALFVAGRALIPVRHAPALRQRMFVPQAGLPDLPR